MIHTLLSLMLVATQVLSGNSAALYVCLEGDGSYCLDFGPSTCGCCRQDAAGDGHGHDCDPHDACGHHADQMLAGGSNPSEPACPCEHVQISEPLSATVHKAAAPLGDHLSAAPLAVVTDLAVNLLTATLHDSLSSRFIDGASSPLALRASVVLRC